MQINRLFGILYPYGHPDNACPAGGRTLCEKVYYLLEKGRATAPELAAKFEVSTMTIYRDVDNISSAGIPIYVTAGRNGGFNFLTTIY